MHLSNCDSPGTPLRKERIQISEASKVPTCTPQNANPLLNALNFPLTNFDNPNIYVLWEVMRYEDDAEREIY